MNSKVFHTAGTMTGAVAALLVVGVGSAPAFGFGDHHGTAQAAQVMVVQQQPALSMPATVARPGLFHGWGLRQNAAVLMTNTVQQQPAVFQTVQQQPAVFQTVQQQPAVQVYTYTSAPAQLFVSNNAAVQSGDRLSAAIQSGGYANLRTYLTESQMRSLALELENAWTEKGGRNAALFGVGSLVDVFLPTAVKIFSQFLNIPTNNNLSLSDGLTNDLKQLISQLIQGNGRLGTNPPTTAPPPAPVANNGQVTLQITGGTINATVSGGNVTPGVPAQEKQP